MATTDEQINSAVPPAGTPNRAQTNAILKDIRTSAELGANIATMVQRETPSSGDTIDVGTGRSNVSLILEGEGTIAALTLHLPDNGSQRPGQIVRVVSLIGVDELSFAPGVNVWNVPAQLFVNDAFTVQNIGLNEWIKVE